MDAEASTLEEQINGSPVGEELGLQERIPARKEGDVVIRLGRRVYRIDRDIIKALPAGMGNLIQKSHLPIL